MTDDNKINEEKISLALQKALKLHIVKKDGIWRNGYVKELSADFFLFVDDVVGQEPIFFLEISTIEPFMEGKK